LGGLDSSPSNSDPRVGHTHLRYEEPDQLAAHAALQLARSSKSGRNEAAQPALLAAQTGTCPRSVGRLREAQGRPAQAC